MSASGKLPFSDIFMRLAEDVSLRSTCAKVQKGCVVTTVDFGKVLAFAYNGSSEGRVRRCAKRGFFAGRGECDCREVERNITCLLPDCTKIPKRIFITHLPAMNLCGWLITIGTVKSITYMVDSKDSGVISFYRRNGIRVNRH